MREYVCSACGRMTPADENAAKFYCVYCGTENILEPENTAFEADSEHSRAYVSFVREYTEYVDKIVDMYKKLTMGSRLKKIVSMGDDFGTDHIHEMYRYRIKDDAEYLAMQIKAGQSSIQEAVSAVKMMLHQDSVRDPALIDISVDLCLSVMEPYVAPLIGYIGLKDIQEICSRYVYDIAGKELPIQKDVYKQMCDRINALGGVPTKWPGFFELIFKKKRK